MSEPIQPIVPEGTPLPPAPVGVPPFPITPFAVWTWSSPVIPEFYWNVYSSEQRIKQICKEIGKIEAFLSYLVNETNKNIIELHQRIDQLTERVAALEKHVEEEIARLDGLIAQLRADLEQEIRDREQGDENLDRRITQEIHDRQDADQVLHNEISQEVQDRIHADDQLHEEISHRLLPTDIQAGAEISITRPDPNSNTIVIASTVAHSIEELENTVSGLQAALTAETEERRADDQNLWTAVNERIERGKILAGAGIKVVNDPDESTVTISATGGGTGGGSTTVTGTAPVEVTGDPEEGYTVGVSAATEDSAGVITEARVKELAGEAGPSLSAEAPLKLEDGELSLTKDPNGPVTSSSAGLSVREITPDTESESEAGVVSKETIKSLAQYSGGVNQDYGLNPNAIGGLRVKASKEVFGFNSQGELALSNWNTNSHEQELTLPARGRLDRSGKPCFITDLGLLHGTLGNAPKFWLVNAYFKVKKSSSAEWQDAEQGTFEAVVEAWSTSGTLYIRCTPYGANYYAGSEAGNNDSWSIAAVKFSYSWLCLPIEVSAW